MTPQEKSDELIEKYYQAIFDLVDVNNAFTYSKQCALIAADEIISSYSQYKGMHDQEFIDADVKYWQSVKEEITKLNS